MAMWFADQVPIDGSVWSVDVAKSISILWADPNEYAVIMG